MSEQQRDVFLASEGNAYFSRNDHAHDPGGDPVLRAMDAMQLKPADVLEIGCADGWRLEAMRARGIRNCTGLDPSGEAVAAGRQRFPQLRLEQGTADSLPFAAAAFDVIVFGFCLYLVDRADLFRVVSEADRTLREGGSVLIYDFDPPAPCRNPYRHRPGIYSYKMSYEKLFCANPAYVLTYKAQTTHSGLAALNDPNERLAVSVIRKLPASAYLPGPLGV